MPRFFQPLNTVRAKLSLLGYSVGSLRLYVRRREEVDAIVAWQLHYNRLQFLHQNAPQLEIIFISLFLIPFHQIKFTTENANCILHNLLLKLLKTEKERDALWAFSMESLSCFASRPFPALPSCYFERTKLSLHSQYRYPPNFLSLILTMQSTTILKTPTFSVISRIWAHKFLSLNFAAKKKTILEKYPWHT